MFYKLSCTVLYKLSIRSDELRIDLQFCW